MTTPILFLSALSAVSDRVRGLRAGGDDYLTKPFDYLELTARVDALARRPTAPASPSLEVERTIGDLHMDLLNRRVWRSGQEILLLPREFALLDYLMRHAGQVLTRAMIFEQVWGYHYDAHTNVIDVHMTKLRRKLDHGRTPPVIETVRGSGYRLLAL